MESKEDVLETSELQVLHQCQVAVLVDKQASAELAGEVGDARKRLHRHLPGWPNVPCAVDALKRPRCGPSDRVWAGNNGDGDGLVGEGMVAVAAFQAFPGRKPVSHALVADLEFERVANEAVDDAKGDGAAAKRIADRAVEPDARMAIVEASIQAGTAVSACVAALRVQGLHALARCLPWEIRKQCVDVGASLGKNG